MNLSLCVCVCVHLLVCMCYQAYIYVDVIATLPIGVYLCLLALRVSFRANVFHQITQSVYGTSF